MLKTLTDLAAKVSDLTLQTVALQPLLPLTMQLDGLPDKVTKLQAAAFEGSNQIAALNLAMSRLERAHRGDKQAALDDDADGDASEHGPHRTRDTTAPRPPENEDYDPRFHPRARIEFRRSTAKKTHCRGLTAAKRSSGARTRQSAAVFRMHPCISREWRSYGIIVLS